MKIKHTFSVILLVLFSYSAKAGNNDSTLVANTLQELASICKNVDFTDPKANEIGFFYKAAPYVVYRGEDKKRAWKDIANYLNPDEKKGVDDVCERINQSVNQSGSNYKIIRYFTETESEGIWHILMVSFIKKGVVKKAAFAFLKINGKFLLGDID